MFRYNTQIAIAALLMLLAGSCEKKNEKADKPEKTSEKISSTPQKKWPVAVKLWSRELSTYAFSIMNNSKYVYGFGFRKGKKSFRPKGQFLLDAQTGITKWFRKRNPGMFGWAHPDGVNASLNGDQVIFTTRRRQITSLDTTAGKLIKGIKSSAGFIDLGDRLFVADNPPYFLSRDDGKKEFIPPLKQTVESIPVKISRKFKPRNANGTILLRTVDGTLRGIDSLTGKELWTFIEKIDDRDYALDIPVSKSTALIPTVYPSTLPSSEISVYNGESVNKVKIPGLFIARKTPVLYKNILSCFSRLSWGGILLNGIDVETGKIRYSVEVPSDTCSIVSGIVSCRYASTLNIYDQMTGKMTKTLQYSSRIRFLARKGKFITIQLNTGRYHILSLPDGKELWKGEIKIKEMKTTLKKMVWSGGDRIGLVVKTTHPRQDRLNRIYLHLFSLAMNFAGTNIQLGKVPEKTFISSTSSGKEIPVNFPVWYTENRIFSALDSNVMAINPETGLRTGGFTLPGKTTYQVSLIHKNSDVAVLKKGNFLVGISGQPRVVWQKYIKNKEVSYASDRHVIIRGDKSSVIYNTKTGTEISNPFDKFDSAILTSSWGNEFRAVTDKGQKIYSNGAVKDGKLPVFTTSTGKYELSINHVYDKPQGKGSWTALDSATGKVKWKFTYKESRGDVGSAGNIGEIPVAHTSLNPPMWLFATDKAFGVPGPAGKCIYFISPENGKTLKTVCFYRLGSRPVSIPSTPWLVFTATGAAYIPGGKPVGENPRDEGILSVWVINTDDWSFNKIIENSEGHSMYGPGNFTTKNDPLIFTVFTEKLFIKKSSLEAWKINWDLK
ncbi:MAG: PQQ-binding-like beta-propeller repeat protein [Deltaproteobacteria bacterium]|nr:PQQ-binding-like beta-propeller repeat protein [Deltaproteobacteria bacterium]